MHELKTAKIFWTFFPVIVLILHVSKICIRGQNVQKLHVLLFFASLCISVLKVTLYIFFPYHSCLSRVTLVKYWFEMVHSRQKSVLSVILSYLVYLAASCGK